MKIEVISDFHLRCIPEINRFFLLPSRNLSADDNSERFDGIRIFGSEIFNDFIGNIQIRSVDGADPEHFKKDLSRRIYVGSRIVSFIEFITVQFFINFFKLRTFELTFSPRRYRAVFRTENHSVGLWKFFQSICNLLSEKFSADNLIIKLNVLSDAEFCFLQYFVEFLKNFCQIAPFFLSEFGCNSVNS